MNKIIKLKNFPEVEGFLRKNDVTFIQMLENKTWGFIIIYKDKINDWKEKAESRGSKLWKLFNRWILKYWKKLKDFKTANK